MHHLINLHQLSCVPRLPILCMLQDGFAHILESFSTKLVQAATEQTFQNLPTPRL